MVGTAALLQGKFEDETRARYIAGSAILAVISDLQRGADGAPLGPVDYIPPTLNFDDKVPNVSIAALEAETTFQTVATRRIIAYDAGANPAASVGATVLGGREELAEDDGSYFRVSAPSGATRISYEATSSVIGFSSVDFGQVELKLRAWEEGVSLQVFVFNPQHADAGSDGYRLIPDAANLLDHHHALDDQLPETHTHNDDHEREAHLHDADQSHGQGGNGHNHNEHHALNTNNVHDFNLNAADLHHNHHDDTEHERDESHSHHGSLATGTTMTAPRIQTTTTMRTA